MDLGNGQRIVIDNNTAFIEGVPDPHLGPLPVEQELGEALRDNTLAKNRLQSKTR